MPNASKAPPITVEQYEEFEGFPGLRDQLIYGRIVMSPQPKPLHQQVVKNLLTLLTQALKAQDYTAQTNTNLRFSSANSMPAPDVLVVTKEQWKKACETDQFLSAPPILVVEVVSPANRKLSKKIDLYREREVVETWIIDPKKHLIKVFRGNDESSIASDTLRLPHPLAGSIKTAAIFQIELPD